MTTPEVRVDAVSYSVGFSPAVMAIRDAVRFGGNLEPSRAMLCVLLGHSYAEQAKGEWVVLPCYNWAGIKWVPNCGANWAAWDTTEGHGADAVRLHAQPFRAFSSLDASCRHYVSFLAGGGNVGRRYIEAWRAARRGEPGDFVRELRKGDYFTGLPDLYVQRVSKGWGVAALRMLGYGASPEEIRRYQATHAELVADGVAGPLTRATLRADLDARDGTRCG